MIDPCILPFSQHMPDQGPVFQAEQGVARRATRERATMLSGLGRRFWCKKTHESDQKKWEFSGYSLAIKMHVPGLPARLFDGWTIRENPQFGVVDGG